ncbi:glutaredoxin domain-containing protein [Kribbella sp. VKM Ac-2568]|uniref:glutaredoxin domain-containing protein n=1 Tax=Kribbella sp. VKM Ac-2568 TaxID=2512219 RepID=UPI0018EEBE80|nr:glutaredoxin domain-containing protein [Kribbella sp. VKM Ac-2568]
MLRSWMLAGLVCVCGLLAAASQVAAGSPGSGVVLAVAFCALAALMSPLAFPRSITAAEAQHRSTDDGRAIIYWRPGCQYCIRLRLKLGRLARRAYWVNIWTDPEAAAAVRAITGGNETVPTVVHAGHPQVNPDPDQLRRQLLAD